MNICGDLGKESILRMTIKEGIVTILFNAPWFSFLGFNINIENSTFNTISKSTQRSIFKNILIILGTV